MSRRMSSFLAATVILLALSGRADAQHKGAAPHHAPPQHQQPQMHFQPMPQFHAMPYFQAMPQFQMPRQQAQAHHNNGGTKGHPANVAVRPQANAGVKSPQINTKAVAGISSQGMNFPSNAIHFPSNAINFPSNAITFPNNKINFPNEASNWPPPTLNFPSNAIHFPSYATNFGVGAGLQSIPSTLGGVSAQNQAVNNGMAAVSTGMPIGVASIYHGVPHHYHYGNSYRYPYSYSAYRTANPNGLTPAQRHYRKVVADLDSLRPGFALADHHRHTLRNDIMAMSVQAPRPGYPAVQQLAANLSNAMVRRQGQAINTAVIAGDIQVVVNAPRLASSDVQQAMYEAKAHLLEGGISPSDVQLIVADMNLVATSYSHPGQSLGIR